ncbi:MAG: hypothetical protein NTV24_04230, partial [Candidatus Woesebacteria bacterium]|nr:hypothetical protein [Candidatus Woesebacteria bacterium]
MKIRKRTAIFIPFLVTVAFLLPPKTILAGNITPSVTKKVMVINFDPVIESQNNIKLSEYYYWWNNPRTLSQEYINDVRQVSGGYVNYEIAEWDEVDDFPLKQNGFDFNDDSYLQCVPNRNCDEGMVNYQKILTDFQVCEKRNSGAIDELWLWGAPWFGYWEAIMVGPNAFSTNGPAITFTTCQKQLNVMGFSYERGVPEMLEDLGHRVEGTMTHLFGSWNAYTPIHNWDKFAQTDH